MHVRDGMSHEVLSVGPGHTLQQAARLMSKHDVGAAVVLDPDGEGPGIITERDVLRSVAAGQDPASELVRDHQTNALTTAVPDQTVTWAAETMLNGNFRHLVVVDDRAEPCGMLSVRDVVRELLESVRGRSA